MRLVIFETFCTLNAGLAEYGVWNNNVKSQKHDTRQPGGGTRNGQDNGDFLQTLRGSYDSMESYS